jgi:transposase
MNEVTVIGIDLAKSVFEVCLKAADGSVLNRRRLRRGAFERYMVEVPRVKVGLEAGPGAHHWARWLERQGFEVKVMSPRAVRAYRTGPHKSDALDADAVAEAAGRASVRAVPVKSEEAQTSQALVRVRDRRIAARTRVLNQLRSLLLEFGIVASRHLLTGYSALALRPEFAALDDRTRRLFDELFEEALALHHQVKQLDRELAQNVRANPVARRLTTAPGIGPINASQLVSQIIEPGDFETARAMSAYLGIVPRLIASGKTRRLGPITKHGSAELRKTLVLGGHSIARIASRYPDKNDPIYVFARRLIAKGKPRNVVAVAVANKLARIACAMLKSGQPYDPNYRAT